MFTLILSILLLNEKPNYLKFLGVLTVILGVVAIGVSDNKGNESILGDVFGLLGAIIYAAYSVFLKMNAVKVDMTLFFGFLGLFNTIIFLPGFLFINITDIEAFELPS